MVLSVWFGHVQGGAQLLVALSVISLISFFAFSPSPLPIRGDNSVRVQTRNRTCMKSRISLDDTHPLCMQVFLERRGPPMYTEHMTCVSYRKTYSIVSDGIRTAYVIYVVAAREDWGDTPLLRAIMCTIFCRLHHMNTDTSHTAAVAEQSSSASYIPVFSWSSLNRCMYPPYINYSQKMDV